MQNTLALGAFEKTTNMLEAREILSSVLKRTRRNKTPSDRESFWYVQLMIIMSSSPPDSMEIFERLLFYRAAYPFDRNG